MTGWIKRLTLFQRRLTMQVSPYETKFTREHRLGKINPERDMTNRKAEEMPLRRYKWASRNSQHKI